MNLRNVGKYVFTSVGKNINYKFRQITPHPELGKWLVRYHCLNSPEGPARKVNAHSQDWQSRHEGTLLLGIPTALIAELGTDPI